MQYRASNNLRAVVFRLWQILAVSVAEHKNPLNIVSKSVSIKTKSPDLRSKLSLVDYAIQISNLDLVSDLVKVRDFLLS